MNFFKTVVRFLNIDHIARRFLYFFKKYEPNRNVYSKSIYINDFYTDNNVPLYLKERLKKNPVSCISFLSCDNKKNVYGIKYWKDHVYSLRRIRSYNDFRPLSSIKGVLYYVKNNRLYKREHGKETFLCFFKLRDREYSEMVALDDLYAIRTGDTIYVSDDLITWKVIYKGKRGIKNSMVIAYKNDDVVLLFIEYTAGISNDNHCVLQYSFTRGELIVLKEFLNTRNKVGENEGEYIRHIHVIQQDPYTGDIYIGTGDSDEESSIFVSYDIGDTWERLCTGSQRCRTLSFLFTSNTVYWNTDTFEEQYIESYNKETREKNEYPLLNGALWCTIEADFDGKHFYVMSSNSEGALYDNKNRVYGIVIENERPIVYELLAEQSKTIYSQHFPLCVHDGILYFYYSHYDIVESFELVKCQNF